ncbi:alpha/beta fold hydrolase [Actinomadura sp. WMMB 499]|uniref:alpha/beta fold hydrolase n=1 Tax=Actinomadura sp. WMMB 499 TaxID=1219491 RepID=UPI001249201B|nr:alpha/beta fold hydrolase [Actinomadura sp. WMMB 499]QFG20247.1 alpha/beta hydrolase [Actinomadura sp. WMMB 499]
MNDVEELKTFAAVHARTQRITPRRCAEILRRVRSDKDGAPDSWTRVWCEAAEELERRGHPLDAGRHYAMARFPFVDGPAREHAHRRCVEMFEVWRGGQPGVERLDAADADGRFGCYAAGLSSEDPQPLLIVMGGIVSVKEQWAPTLRQAARLGMACVVTEMPGVGENGVPYTPHAHTMLSRVIDAVGARADTGRTYALALSFGGHLALRGAAADPRLRGVVTTGAPVGPFFTDAAWRRAVPRVTMDTLAHLTGTARRDLDDVLPRYALGPADLVRVRVPVRYVASLRDEIVPRADVALLRAHLSDLKVLELDDVHASPGHLAESSLWTARSLLELRGGGGAQAALLGGLLAAFRTRRRLTAPRDRAVRPV